MVEIDNKIYYINYIECVDCVYVSLFGIKKNYRGRGYSRRIFNNLQRKYGKPIYLECWHTLIPFYEKIGFFKVTEDIDYQEYNEMILPVNVN